MNVKKFNIVAIKAKIVYNKYGDHDPNGLMFVRAEDEKAVLSGKMEPKPLILRANAGDLFAIHGHSWRQQDKDPLSPIVSTAGAISVGNVFNYTLQNGANCLPDDYCYRSGSFRWDYNFDIN